MTKDDKGYMDGPLTFCLRGTASVQVFDGLESFYENKFPASLTIGNFDGVHRGHQSIVEKLVTGARQAGGPSALISFNPHPAYVLNPALTRKNLQTQTQFKESLATLSLDYLIIEKFDHSYSEKSASQFFDRIYNRLKFKQLLIGYDFKFGKEQRGDFSFLKTQSEKHSFDLIQVTPFLLDGETVSSSLIRQLLSMGEVEKAGRFLGRKYEVRGRVVHGEGNGTKLKFPTINLKTDNDLFLAKGVYQTTVYWKGIPYKSITNFGRAPTVQTNRTSLVETHLLEFNQNLYDEDVIIEFDRFLRPEKKFASLDDLKKQIRKDIASLNS